MERLTFLSRMWKHRWFRYPAILVGCVLFIFVALNLLFPLPVEKLNRPHARIIFSREGEALNLLTSDDRFWRFPTVLDSISPIMITAATAVEDRWFRYHPGINPISLLSAFIENISEGRIVRGGSTITMQVARMMEPKERTISGKAVELFRALQLELYFSKDELLQYYFNLAPYGGNLEGVGAAAWFYFGKQPDQLTISEAAILAAIPMSPNRYRPDINPEACRMRRDKILASVYGQGLLTAQEYNDAKAEEIPIARNNRPDLAPHFCLTAAAKYPDRSVLRSTIDAHTQRICEQVARQYYPSLVERGIHSVSLVVLDNQRSEVLAMVGSPVFDDIAHGGQINGTLSPRSPGSTLKPFIYALAIDSGLLAPATTLADIPVSYSGYKPDNYDDSYHGIVSVEEALTHSFNVPAVNVTAQVGVPTFCNFLKQGGLTTVTRKPYDYGLPIILGAVDVSLYELCNLYATLARGGEYRPVKMMLSSDSVVSRRLLSKASAWLTTDMLKNLERPELNSSWEFSRDLPTIAWKTGTSYGRKDGWAIGYTPRFTVGVWTGNMDGAGSPYIVGIETAAPLMIDIFNAIDRKNADKWFPKPENVRTRLVCSVTGLLPNEHCPNTIPAEYVYGVTSLEQCRVHQQIVVAQKTGHQVCPLCVGTSQTDTITIEQWPPKISSWLLASGMNKPLPQHNPLCSRMLAEDKPVIISPENKGVYELRADIPVQYQQLLFNASTTGGTRKVHWFLDDNLYATLPSSEQLFYTPAVGKHNLRCVDENGRSHTVTFTVQ